ncbi:MAG: hypothetical protein KF762_15375 [Acidobacteria bacterium]|nr:hypothetical protein [Acidobacteriota bacterium]
MFHALVRADGIGSWAAALDDIIAGVASDHLQKEVRNREKRELTEKCGSGSWQHESVSDLQKTLNIFNLSGNQTGAKVQLKTWFSLFSTLRNGTRGHGAPLNDLKSAACVPLRASIDSIVTNFSLFQREWAFLHQNLSGKYRVTGLTDSVTQFDELKSKRFGGSEYPDGLYVFFGDRTRVMLIESDPDCSDFYYPNGNFRSHDFELLSYISGSRKSRENGEFLIPAEELPESETAGLGKLEAINESLSNIPPIATNYVSRTSLEEELSAKLAERDRYPIVTLKGVGGIGKTSLAVKVLHDLTTIGRFDMILWFSSRDIDLKFEGPKPVRSNVLNQGDVAEELWSLLELNKANIGEKTKYLSEQLSESEYGPTLFVFDNFETVRNPSEFFAWLDTYIRCPNKILITSRISTSFKADYPIEVSGMAVSECKELIRTTAASFGIEARLSEDEITKIIDVSNGHPYILRILLGAYEKQRSFDIRNIVANKDEILNALFRRTYDFLSPSAKRVFLTLSSWNSIVPQIALAAILLRPENDWFEVDEAVEELRKSSLIDVSISEVDDEVFISVPLAASIFGRKELQVSPERLLIENDRKLLEEFGAAQHSSVAKGVSPRIERKFRSVATQISEGKAKLEFHLPSLEYLAGKFPKGWLYIADLHKEFLDPKKEQDALREYLKTEQDIYSKKDAWWRLARVYEHLGNTLGRIDALVECARLGEPSIAELSDLANLINRNLSKESIELEVDVKRGIVNDVISMIETVIDQANATDLSRLAWLYLASQNEEKALHTARLGLAKESQNEFCQNLISKITK